MCTQNHQNPPLSQSLLLSFSNKPSGDSIHHWGEQVHAAYIPHRSSLKTFPPASSPEPSTWREAWHCPQTCPVWSTLNCICPQPAQSLPLWWHHHCQSCQHEGCSINLFSLLFLCTRLEGMQILQGEDLANTNISLDDLHTKSHLLTKQTCGHARSFSKGHARLKQSSKAGLHFTKASC